MSRERVFTVNESVATPLRAVGLADKGLLERQHLEEWIIANPDVLGDEVLILTSEYDRWQTASGEHRSDRLDILGLEPSGRLVVVELKRDVADRSVELQALKYAALVSRFTTTTLIQAHAAFRGRRGEGFDPELAREAIEGHLGGELDPESLRQPRIVIMASSFPETVTNTVVWLTEMGLDISLVRYQLYGSQPASTLVVSQLWPPQEVSDFVLEPRRDEARTAAARTVETSRQRDVVSMLVESAALEPGTALTVRPVGINQEMKALVVGWLEAEPTRSRAIWTGDPAGPIMWEADGSRVSPSRLARRIVRVATGEDRSLRGTQWLVTSEGLDLIQVAAEVGMVGGGGRDWSDLHAILEGLPQGRWTSYGDVARAIGSVARAVGTHIRDCQVCTNAHRVLTVDGSVAEGFQWSDPAETGSPRQMLEEEGVPFDPSGRADQSNRLSESELRRLTVSGNAGLEANQDRS